MANVNKGDFRKFPQVVCRANTNATTIMIEERAADFMLCVQAFESIVSSHLRLRTRCKTKIGRFQTVQKLLALEVYPESG